MSDDNALIIYCFIMGACFGTMLGVMLMVLI